MAFTKSDELADELYRQPDLEEKIGELQQRLKSEQQRRREYYAWLDEDKKAEFINGEIVVHSPVRKRHADATNLITLLLTLFNRKHKLGYVATEKILVQLKRNDFEPDVAFWRREKADAFTEDQLFFPAPDLIVEVLSPSTEQYDRGEKFQDYAANGIQEYWIVDSEKRVVECYELDGATYRERAVISKGQTLQSTAVENFSVPLMSAFDEDANQQAIFDILGVKPL